MVNEMVGVTSHNAYDFQGFTTRTFYPSVAFSHRDNKFRPSAQKLEQARAALAVLLLVDAYNS